MRTTGCFLLVCGLLVTVLAVGNPCRWTSGNVPAPRAVTPRAALRAWPSAGAPTYRSPAWLRQVSAPGDRSFGVRSAWWQAPTDLDNAASAGVMPALGVHRAGAPGTN